MSPPCHDASVKDTTLPIRVSAARKALLRRKAAAGMNLSARVLERPAPQGAQEWKSLVEALRDPDRRTHAFAGIHDLLVGIPPGRPLEDVLMAPPADLPHLFGNQLAALVEIAAHRGGVSPPGWVNDIPPLSSPWFAGDLRSLRPWLLRHSPVPFRRRNLFVGTTLGSRV